MSSRWTRGFSPLIAFTRQQRQQEGVMCRGLLGRITSMTVHRRMKQTRMADSTKRCATTGNHQKESEANYNYEMSGVDHKDDSIGNEGLLYFDSFHDDDEDDDDEENSNITDEELIVDDDDEEDEEHEEDELDSNDEPPNAVIHAHVAWCTAVQTTLQALETKSSSLQRELDKAKALDQTVLRAQLIVSHLYRFQQEPHLTTITIQDWDGNADVELALDPLYESAAAEADALFAQARKLKRGSAVVQELITQTDHAIEIMKQYQVELKAMTSDETGTIIDEEQFLVVQQKLKDTSKKTNFQLPSLQSTSTKSQQKKRRVTSNKSTTSIMETSVRKLMSPGGCVVLVGRNRRGNDYISMHVARGNDIWMHARGRPGAHVVLQSRRGSPPVTQACLDFCANVAAFYSDARTETKTDVTAAEPKHLLKPRGAPLGAVKVREELYTLTGWPDDVPDALKEAREKSGMTDEFRAKDKQKHRRRTADVAKQTQAKKRSEQKAKRKRGGQSKSSSSDDLPDFF